MYEDSLESSAVAVILAVAAEGRQPPQSSKVIDRAHYQVGDCTGKGIGRRVPAEVPGQDGGCGQ